MKILIQMLASWLVGTIRNRKNGNLPPRNYYTASKLPLITFLLIIGICWQTSVAQTYVNVSWSQANGLPDPQIPWTSSEVYGGDYLYVLGNTTTSNQGVDILLTKYDTDGQLVWQQTYNHADSADDYGIDLIVDDQGDVVICAASLSDANETSDYLVLKYSSSGVLDWDYTYDGPIKGEDYPSSLTFDDYGNIYVTGGSQGNDTIFDYVTVKLQDDGTHEWTERYDRSGYSDVAVKISYWSEEERIVVTGGSGETTSDWDYVTLSYQLDGTLEDDGITNNPGVGFDKPADMVLDSDGSIYITGAASQNGTDYDIYTVKLDSALQLVWEQSYGTSNFEDGGLTIGLNSNNEVWVGGFTGTSSNTVGQLLKYDSLGSLVANPTLTHGTTRSSRVKDIFIKGNDEFLACSEVTSSSVTEIRLAEYSDDGGTKWQQSYSHTAPPSDHPLALSVSPLGRIYVTGLSLQSTGNQYLTLAYDVYDIPLKVDTVPGTTYLYEPDQIIIRVEPEFVDSSRVNETMKPFGKTSEFLDAGLITEMDKVLKTSGDLQKWPLIKVFRNLTTHTTHSISRLGEEVPMPDFWTTFVLRLPNVPDGPSYEASVVAAALDSVPGIRYTELSYFEEVSSTPNDSLYTFQHSLQSTTYPNGHIFAEDAWAYEVGRPEIKVAVFDEGIDWRHPDFGFDGVDTSSSVVKGGTDYHRNSVSILQSFNSVSSFEGNHGTAVAGILGAKRNNQLGIAGIAGGNGFQDGVSLYSMRVCKERACYSVFYIGAYLESVAEDTINGFGFGVHITNHSYSSYGVPPWPTYLEVVNFAYRNHVVQVTSRGNWNNDTISTLCSMTDEHVICVGAAGPDGEKHIKSSYGQQLDLIAPGEVSMIRTTDLTENGLSKYTPFAETSAASPHVAGIAALMLSYINPLPGYDNLAPEDVENILQWTATDKNIPGFDDTTGYGLVHAGRVFARLDTAKYRIRHLSTTVILDTSGSPTLTNINKFIPDDYGLPNGDTNYIVDVYPFQHTLSYTSSPSIRVDTAWVRNSSSTLLGPQDISDSLFALPAITLQSFSQNSATASGYFLYVKSTASGIPIDRFIPDNTAQLAISLYLNDITVLNTHDGSEPLPVELKVYPNPAENLITFQLASNGQDRPIIEIYDLQGRNTYTAQMSADL